MSTSRPSPKPRADRREEAVAGRTDQARLDRMRALDRDAARLHPADRGAGAGRRARRRGAADGGRRRGAAGRHPDRPQGHRRHQGHPHDRAFEAAARTTCRRATPHRAAKWADAGTVLMGKLTTHEFAVGGPSFDLPWPPARNPWNTEHFTAGSSSRHRRGGRGRADPGRHRHRHRRLDPRPGGAVRHRRHQADLRPGQPRRRPAAALQLDHIGPMAWTAEDCALMLQAMAGHDPHDPASADRPVAGLHRRPRQGRQGAAHRRDPPFPRDRQPGRRSHAARHRRRARRLPHLGRRDPRGHPVADGGLRRRRLADLDHRGVRRARGLAARRGSAISASCCATASALGGLRPRRRLSCRRCAAAACCAGNCRRRWPGSTSWCGVRAGRGAEDRRTCRNGGIEKPSFTMPFNVTGYPAISVCAGFGAGGLPVSIQLVGKPFAEPTLLRAAHAYETAMPWRAKRPAMAM